MVTRRVLNGEARLRPTPKTNNLIGYVVTTVANHYELGVNALCGLTNHYHMRANDRDARMSDFERDCHSIIAKLIKHTHGDEEESLWSPKQTNEVRTVLPEDAIDQIAYILSLIHI